MKWGLRWHRVHLLRLVTCMVLLAVGLAVYEPLLTSLQTRSERLTTDWLRAHTLVAPWLRAVPGAGYRPLAFTVWRLSTLLTAEGATLTLRYLALALHLSNALLILALMVRWRMHRGLLVALGTALLFLLFPANYNALWSADSLPLTLGTALTLGALLLSCSATTWRQGRGVLALLLALAAPLAHEAGVLVAPLLALVLTVVEPGLSAQKVFQRTLPVWALSMLGLVLQWSMLAGGQTPGPGLRTADLVGQGVAGWSPVLISALANDIADTGGTLSLAASLLLGAVVIVALRLPIERWKLGLVFVAWLAFLQVPNWALLLLAAWLLLLWAGGCERLLAVALGWLVLWLVMPLVFPSTAGDGTSPLYGASIGTALLWAIPLEVSWARKPIVQVALVCLVLGLGVCGYRSMQIRKPVAADLAQMGMLASCERRGEGVRLTLQWECRQPAEPDVTVFAHLYDAEGHLVAQADGDPLNGSAPFWTCQPGSGLVESRLLALPPGLKRGRYTVMVGLYNRSTGVRVPAIGPDGARFAADAVPVTTLTVP